MDIPFDILGTQRCTSKYVRKRYPEFYEFLQQRYPGLTFSEQTFWYYHNLTEHPVCKICGNPTGYLNFKNGYRDYCSQKCSIQDNPEKIKQTCLKKYGVGNVMCLDQYKEKSKQTCLEKYGVEHSFQSDVVKEKSKQTMIKKYGVEHVWESKELGDKQKKTCLERYGTTCSLGNKEIREKSKQTRLKKYGDENYNNRDKFKETCIERYGVENVFQSEDIKGKSRNTMIEKYGGEYSTTSPILKEKIKQSLIDKYGVDHQSKIPEVKDKLSKTQREVYIKTHDHVVDYTNDVDWICKCPHPECNKCEVKTYTINPLNFYSRKEFNIEPCTTLKPIEGIPNKNTTLELFIHNILKENNIEFKTNNRSIINGLELDIYIPKYNIAVECNGTFFHSDRMKDKNYHINKFNLCKEKGIQLLTFWEDQIFNKPGIVKSVLLSKLGIYDNIIYARKCTVENIDSHTCAQFLNNNHIQGETKPNIRLGLFYQNTLYGVMTFSKKSKLSGSKHINDNEWELTRFCSLLNTTIVGGFAKLLKYFINHYHPSIISSFASNDISSGNIYEKNGFIKDKTTTSYWYIKKKGYIRYHRTSFTKSRLKQLGYDTENKTEFQIMDELPYYRIYDCGHTKYILNIN